MSAETAATDPTQYPFAMTRGEAQALHALVAEEQERLVREVLAHEEPAEDEEGALQEWEALAERLEEFIEGEEDLDQPYSDAKAADYREALRNR